MDLLRQAQEDADRRDRQMIEDYNRWERMRRREHRRFMLSVIAIAAMIVLASFAVIVASILRS